MTLITIVVSIVVLVLAGWVRAVGTAVTRVPRADALRDASDGDRGARVVADLLDQRDSITPAAGVVVSALLVLASVVATVVITRESSGFAALFAALAVGLVIFAFGDLVPRALGRWHPHRVAYRSSWLLRAAVGLGGWANDLLVETENGEVEPEQTAPEEVEEHERELIDSVLEFSETIVREVMTPRPDMVTIPVTASIDELIRVATADGYSRVPVTSGNDIVGMAIVKDLLLKMKEEDPPESVAEVMRPVEFVPETKYASTLLAEMRDSHIHQVIVVDEYGDIAGLVTIEDLLEELVGEISDETDLEETMVVRRGSGWLVDARLPVDELQDLTGQELPNEDWDTVGGLVLGLAERVPEEGEVFTFEKLMFTVTRMQGRRVSEVAVRIDSRIEAV